MIAISQEAGGFWLGFENLVWFEKNIHVLLIQIGAYEEARVFWMVFWMFIMNLIWSLPLDMGFGFGFGFLLCPVLLIFISA